MESTALCTGRRGAALNKSSLTEVFTIRRQRQTDPRGERLPVTYTNKPVRVTVSGCTCAAKVQVGRHVGVDEA